MSVNECWGKVSTPNIFATLQDWRSQLTTYSHRKTQVKSVHHWSKQAHNHDQISIRSSSTLQPSLFISPLPVSSLHSPHFLRTYSTIQCWPVCTVQWDYMCVVQQLVFNRHHCSGYLILQWKWSSAPICSHLPLLHFNYTALIGSASMLWSQRVRLGKQYSDPEFLIGLSLTGEKLWLSKKWSYSSLNNDDFQCKI